MIKSIPIVHWGILTWRCPVCHVENSSVPSRMLCTECGATLVIEVQIEMDDFFKEKEKLSRKQAGGAIE